MARPPVARDPGEPIACPFCGARASGLRPFCPHCGRRLTAPGSGPNCPRCASPVEPGIKFCATCGASLVDLAAVRRAPPPGPSRAGATIALLLLDDLGNAVQRFERKTPDTTIGREDGDIRFRDVTIGREQGDWVFPYDPSMSARHALVRSEDADFVVVDANSRNGIALAARGEMALRDQSRILVGDKLLRIEIPA